MGNEVPVTFAVADDCPIFAEAAARLLQTAFELDDGACRTIAPFDHSGILDVRPDVLILDPIFAQPLDRLVPAWRAVKSSMRLFAFATRPTYELARYCVGLGFHGFLPKIYDEAAFVRAVGVVARGGNFIDKAFGRNLLSAAPDSGLRPLSEREDFVLKRTSLGYSNREIARDLGLSPKTVDSHRARGMTKLGLTERSALVRFAAANGWLN